MIVDFIRNIFSKKQQKSTKEILDSYSTYLTPWYFKGNIPNLGKNYNWKQTNELNGEKFLLTELHFNKTCVGIIDMYCYLKPLTNGQFLFWKRGSRKIELYNTTDLNPINSKNIKWSELKKTYLFDAQPVDSFEYYFDLYQTEFEFDFPNSFSHINEIIQVNDLDGLYPDYEEGIMNVAIVVLKPKENRIEIYPQDWFNRAKDIDFGYQLITRAERINGTDKIKIQGIRIGEYELDKTKRGIIKSTTGNIELS